MENTSYTNRDNAVILLAEDDEGHAQLITKNLKMSGVRNLIINFKDGKEVLEFFEKAKGLRSDNIMKFILLLDIRMPVVDGIEVLQKIQHYTWLKGMPIIVITSSSNTHEAELCYSLGCRDVIVKPVQYPEFVTSMLQLGEYLRSEIFPQMGNA